METLANLYRPKIWAEIIGQPIIVSVLTRQITENKIKNCYLFCGPSGSGKTSAARVFANAVNNNEGKPIEFDAASHSSVQDMRDLIEDSKQMPIDCIYKVYIIDEVQRIQRQAWDVLLKIIEEPPSNTIYIFCTTDASKIPVTILSRIQRFDFRKISDKEIINRLEYICQENLKCDYDNSALNLITSYSDGNMRNAIRYLEQTFDAFGNILECNVESLFKFISINKYIDLLKYILLNNTEIYLNTLDQLYLSDKLNIGFYDEFINIIIDLLFYIKTKNKSIISINEEDLKLFIDNKELLKLVLKRLLYYREFADDKNIKVFLKSILLEVADGYR